MNFRQFTHVMGFGFGLLGLFPLEPLHSAEHNRVETLLSRLLTPIPFPQIAQRLIEQSLQDVRKTPFNETESETFFASIQASLNVEQRELLYRMLHEYSDEIGPFIFPRLGEILSGPNPRQRIRDLMLTFENSHQNARAAFLLRVLARSKSLRTLDQGDEEWVMKVLASKDAIELDLAVALKSERRSLKPLSAETLIEFSNRPISEESFYGREIHREIELRLQSAIRPYHRTDDQGASLLRQILNMPSGRLRAAFLTTFKSTSESTPQSPLLEVMVKALENRIETYSQKERLELLAKLAMTKTKDLKPFRSRIKQILRKHFNDQPTHRDLKELRIRLSSFPREFHHCRDALTGLFDRLAHSFKSKIP